MLCSPVIIPLVLFAREYLRSTQAGVSRNEAIRRRNQGEPEPISAQLQNQLRRWPAKIQASDNRIEAHLGTSPQGDEEQGKMHMAAPFVLCSLIKRFPKGATDYKIRVTYFAELEAASAMEFWLAYDYKTQVLSEVSFGFGGGHGIGFHGVTDKMLLQLEREATQGEPMTININRLRKMGCRTSTW